MQNITKNQHFIPRAYMKYFAYKNDKDPKNYYIWEFDTNTDKISPKPLKNICCEKYLYELIPTAEFAQKGGEVVNYFEKCLGEFETTIPANINRILDKINHKRDELQKKKKIYHIINNDDKEFLALLMVITGFRNNQILNNFAPKVVRKLIGEDKFKPLNVNTQRIALQYWARIITFQQYIEKGNKIFDDAKTKLINDYHCTIQYSKNKNFAFGDFIPNISIWKKENARIVPLQAFMPISPNVNIVFTNKKLRTRFNCENTLFLSNDVDVFNQILYNSVLTNHLYAYKKDTLEQIKRTKPLLKICIPHDKGFLLSYEDLFNLIKIDTESFDCIACFNNFNLIYRTQMNIYNRIESNIERI